MYKKIIGVILLMGLLTTLIGCDELGIKGSRGVGSLGKPNNSELVSFSYTYDGTIGGNNYSYRIKKEDGKYFFTYESMEYRNYGEMEKEIDESVVSSLKDIYLNNKVYQWDEFHRYATNVMDGDGFSLYFDFEEGNGVSASGTNAYPEGFRDFREQMTNLFKPFVEELKEESRLRIIEEGVTGIPDVIMINFIQKGNSGRNSYSLLMFDSEIRDDTFSLKVNDETNEFFEGEHKYYASLPVEALKFDKFDELFKKYEIINWYNWEKAAEDYNNEEWFQIQFGYENVDINAYGTLHPEHYDEFRHDALTLIKEIVDDAITNYGLTEQ